MNNLKLNDQVLWAWKPSALELLNDFVTIGIDRDLAISIMEQLVPETSLYELPTDDTSTEGDVS